MDDSLAANASSMMTQLKKNSDPRAQMVLGIWDGHSVSRSPLENTIAFTNRQLVIGPPTHPAPLLNTHLLLAMADAVPTDAPCEAIMNFLVDVATTQLNWDVEIDCTTCMRTGICSNRDCAACIINTMTCNDTHRPSYPALLGKPLWLGLQILKKHHPHVTIETDTFDMMYQTPLNDTTLRIVYDPKSGLIVPPAPSLGRPEVYDTRESCFITNRAGQCITLPSQAPVEWYTFVGKHVDDVSFQLRQKYPHAIIQGIPQYALLPAGHLRHDRIVLRYDDTTKKITTIPFIG
jgi:hypothetical protein